MFKLAINTTTEYLCPVCNKNLIATDAHLTGMRFFYECECKICTQKFYVDLPTGHGSFYPVFIRISDNKIYCDKKASWFCNLFLKMLTQGKQSYGFKRRGRSKKANIIILNCLDQYYGHSLLKLFSASSLKQVAKTDSDIIAIVSQNIAHLVPDFVKEVWVVSAKPNETVYWSTVLDNEFHKLISMKKNIFVANAFPVSPNYPDFEVNDFIKNTNLKRNNKFTVLFSYRSDRLWGDSLENQRDNIILLESKLRKSIKNLEFVVGNGFRDEISFPLTIIDQRYAKSSLSTEKKLLNTFCKAKITIGVHGSHMIFPSLLSETIINLLPQRKIGNYGQDYLANNLFRNLYQNMYRFITLRGGDNLQDVSVESVYQTIMDLKHNFKWRILETEMGEGKFDDKAWQISHLWKKYNEQ